MLFVQNLLTNTSIYQQLVQLDQPRRRQHHRQACDSFSPYFITLVTNVLVVFQLSEDMDVEQVKLNKNQCYIETTNHY